MVSGASLLEATAFKPPGKTGKTEGVPAPYLFQCKASSLFNWNFAFMQLGLQMQVCSWRFCCRAVRLSRGAQVQIYRRGARTFSTLCVCCLYAHPGWAMCSLRVAVWHNNFFWLLQSQRGCRSGSQRASFLLSFLGAPGCHSTLQIPISTWWGAVI